MASATYAPDRRRTAFCCCPTARSVPSWRRGSWGWSAAAQGPLVPQLREAHPVLGVESLVEERPYSGTAYRATGFEAVGPTEGFKRASRVFYQAHRQPKQRYWRESRPGARRLLRQARLPEELAQDEAEMLAAVRRDWSAPENRAHYRRPAPAGSAWATTPAG